MIVAVAVIGKDGKIYTGEPFKERHHHIINRMSPERQKLPYGFFKGGEQGFIDDKGNYLNRAEAAKHAIECGQVIAGEEKVKREGYSRPFNGHTLYSEDLW